MLHSRRRMQSGSAVPRVDISAPMDTKLSTFHRELTETCTDVMARYMFGNFAPLPQRSDMMYLWQAVKYNIVFHLKTV